MARVNYLESAGSRKKEIVSQRLLFAIARVGTNGKSQERGRNTGAAINGKHGFVRGAHSLATGSLRGLLLVLTRETFVHPHELNLDRVGVRGGNGWTGFPIGPVGDFLTRSATFDIMASTVHVKQLTPSCL